MASFTQKIEVEVDETESAIHAAELGADIIMFDNMTAEDIEKTIRSMDERGLRKGIILEASGGITLENVGKYSRTGVDVISVGALTHSSRWLDISLSIK
jgi:nicotinate-nucleotide pyrophosphorylase (carboxylating)